MQRVHQLGDADQQHHRRKHLAHDDKAKEGFLSNEVHPRHGIGRRNTAEHGQGRCPARHKERVQQITRHTALNDIREVAPDPFGREHVQEIHIQGLCVGAEGRNRHDVVRIERDQADDYHEHIEQPAEQPAFDLTVAQGECRQQ